MSNEAQILSLGPPPFINGRYRLVRQIGKGGMGLIYQAEDERLGRQVAIKFLPPNQINNSARLIREARVVAQLSHPAIMALYDAGQENSWHYLILELLSGQDLRQLLETEKPGFTTRKTLSIIQPVLEALAYAHESDVIHRDIKPENIMVLADGRVKVTDFGLALAATEERLTAEDVLMGTAIYLAPEIIQGQPASAQSDLYATGVVLYEMLTGEPPFKGNNTANTLIEILNTTAAPPSLLKENIPAEWDKLILKLLAKQPEQRPQTAHAVLAALPQIAERQKSVSDPTKSQAPEETAVALEGERQRLANLLQREIIEPLNLLLAQAGMYGQGLSGDPKARTAVSVLTTLARQVMQQARDLEANLHPTILESLGLEPALEAFGNQLRRSVGSNITLKFPRLTERLPQLIELAIFRVTQEVIEAAIYDGRATEITIQMKAENARFRYTIQDNRFSDVGTAVLPATRQQIVQFDGKLTSEYLEGRYLFTLHFDLSPVSQPTPRELEVLQYVAAGKSNKEIALALKITPRTVNFHLDNIYSKLNVNSRTEAAMVALRQGWVVGPG